MNRFVPKQQDENRLYVYHCYCSKMVLVLDTMLEALPVRVADGSRVAILATQVQKINAVEGGTVYLKRSNGIETQHRLNCSRCGLRLFYRPSLAEESKFLYIVNGALFLTPPVLPAIAAAAFHKKMGSADTPALAGLASSAGGFGRMGVAASTTEEEEEEKEVRYLQDEYSSNARIVAAAMSSKRRAEDDVSGEEKRRRKGTLL